MFKLLKLNGCNAKERFVDWQKSGSTLLDDKTVGCGINSLTFLGVFTREQGARIVETINTSDVVTRNLGTPFKHLINFVYSKNQRIYSPGVMNIKDYTFDISTLKNTSLFLDLITLNLGKNTCTIAKLNRGRQVCGGESVTPGHTIILSTDEHGRLYFIDPQQGTMRQRENDVRLFTSSWQRNCYNTISVMCVKDTSESVRLKKLTPRQRDIISLVNSFSEPEITLPTNATPKQSRVSPSYISPKELMSVTYL